MVAIAIPLFIGYLPSIWLRDEPKSDWYKSLKKAPWTPPNWMFPVAWTTIYICDGIASFLVYRHGDGFTGKARYPLIFYAATIIISTLWKPVFFGWHLIKLATAHIVLILLMVVALIIAFARVYKVAALLLIPYISWMCLATSVMIYTCIYN